MISGSLQSDIGKKLVNLVLHKYLNRSDLQPTNSLLCGFTNDLEKTVDGAFALSMRKEMEFMSNTKKEIEIKERRIFINNKIRKQPLRPAP